MKIEIEDGSKLEDSNILIVDLRCEHCGCLRRGQLIRGDQEYIENGLPKQFCHDCEKNRAGELAPKNWHAGREERERIEQMVAERGD